MMAQYLKRYSIIIPAEHGSWSLMLTPYLIGAGLGWGLVGGSIPAILLCAIAVLSLFLMRQPTMLWLRVRRGRGRQDDGRLALFWIILLLVISGVCGIGLIVLGRMLLFWLILPATLILLLTVGLSAAIGARTLIIELLGVIGLALAAPAGYVAGSAMFDQATLIVFTIAAAHNLISVLYVRYRVDRHHQREADRQTMTVIAAHSMALVLIVFLGILAWFPILIALPFALLLIRAALTPTRPSTIPSIKRFGFTEMGFALAFAVYIIVLLR